MFTKTHFVKYLMKPFVFGLQKYLICCFIKLKIKMLYDGRNLSNYALTKFYQQNFLDLNVQHELEQLVLVSYQIQYLSQIEKVLRQ